MVAPAGMLAFQVTFPLVVLGVITGLTYGLLALGLTLIYRSNRMINFAHGEIGAFAATLFLLASRRWGIPYWPAFALALLAGGGVGAGVEVVAIRRLRSAPRIMSVVATLGAGQFLLFLGAALLGSATSRQTGAQFPQPSGMPSFSIGALRITPAYSAILLLTPVVVLALVLFLQRTRVGIAIRGAAANPDRAQTCGVNVSRMSMVAWALAGGLATFSAILVFPTRAFVGQALGPGLLLRALVPAVIARMTNLRVAFACGIGIGVIEQVLYYNNPSGGQVELLLFLMILVALFLQRREVGRDEERGSWAAVDPPRPALLGGRPSWLGRHLQGVGGGVALALAVLVPLFGTTHAAGVGTLVLATALVGLSLGIITGLCGQLSLGQFALAGIGAAVSARVAVATGFFPAGILAGMAAAALASVVIGLPALRIRGLFLAATTLGFALVTSVWLLQQPWLLGSGVDPGRPKLGSFIFDTSRRYYWVSLIAFALAFALAVNVRRGGVGRMLLAVRDNENQARAFGIPVRRLKLQAFVLSGALAGLGGLVYGHSLSRLAPDVFTPAVSVTLVAITVLGGLGSVAGPLLGALYLIAVPEFLPLDSAELAATSLGWLLLILYFPGGLAQVVEPVRRRIRAVVGHTGGSAADPAEAVVTATPAAMAPGRSLLLDVVPSATPQRRPSPNGSDALLLVTHLTKRYEGVVAVDDVSLRVMKGQTLGLIGPNGAGKTTLFELIGGFTPPTSGRVMFAGEDVTALGPEQRAARGLVRSFQDAGLFATLTVLDTLKLACERTARTSFTGSLAGLPGRERRKDAAARELVELMGLEAFATKYVRELSTGTRRIVELACMVAMGPKLLLLDEPSSGIAQRETEALGTLLAGLKRYLDATLVIIEHDMPMLLGLSDVVVAMNLGAVIAEGSPDEIRLHEEVISSYLGTDRLAIERSGPAGGVVQPGRRSRRERPLVAAPAGAISERGAS
jgi:ABC-type branched-subunit amino acid transport system ATPase component/ABC-type branched-subunit amino acid transport system permease subunit